MKGFSITGWNSALSKTVIVFVFSSLTQRATQLRQSSKTKNNKKQARRKKRKTEQSWNITMEQIRTQRSTAHVYIYTPTLMRKAGFSFFPKWHHHFVNFRVFFSNIVCMWTIYTLRKKKVNWKPWVIWGNGNK